MGVTQPKKIGRVSLFCMYLYSVLMHSLRLVHMTLALTEGYC